MKLKDEDIIYVNNQDDLDYLIERIENGPQFAKAFKFGNENDSAKLLAYLKIDNDEYNREYYYSDKIRNIHISESEFGYTWISTLGLVAKGKATSNKFVNACVNQYTVVSLLLDKAFEICENSEVYDVDGYNFGYLSELTPALFHNTLFYIEVFGKAYLSLSGASVPHTHELSKVFSLVKNMMYKNNHDNTVFQARIIAEFQKGINYIELIPGGFKEHFVKYDDNPEDGTVICFDKEKIYEIHNVVDMSNDFISSYYYDKESALYLMPGLLERLIDKAETEKEKQQVINMYGYMGSGN
jgi:hypothetical protein